MKESLQNYLDIESAGFHKQKRNELHQKFLDYLNIEKLTFGDLSDFLSKCESNKTVIRQPFFESVVYPILEKEIGQNNLQAIKHLIKLEQNLIQLQIKLKNYKPTKRQLIVKGLEINSDDAELLKIYEEDLRNYLRYTIHEIPRGVLYGINGADEFQCEELLKLLSQYKEICERLSFNRTDLIEECEFHFRNYKIYLQNSAEFGNYEDYLKNK